MLYGMVNQSTFKIPQVHIEIHESTLHSDSSAAAIIVILFILCEGEFDVQMCMSQNGHTDANTILRVESLLLLILCLCTSICAPIYRRIPSSVPNV